MQRVRDGAESVMSERLMMKRYEAPLDVPLHVKLPNYARVLHAEMAPDGRPVMEFWTEVYCDREGRLLPRAEPRAYRVVATDQEIPDGWHHVASARSPGGPVFHLIERGH